MDIGNHSFVTSCLSVISLILLTSFKKKFVRLFDWTKHSKRRKKGDFRWNLEHQIRKYMKWIHSSIKSILCRNAWNLWIYRLYRLNVMFESSFVKRFPNHKISSLFDINSENCYLVFSKIHTTKIVIDIRSLFSCHFNVVVFDLNFHFSFYFFFTFIFILIWIDQKFIWFFSFSFIFILFYSFKKKMIISLQLLSVILFEIFVSIFYFPKKEEKLAAEWLKRQTGYIIQLLICFCYY